MNKRKHKVIRMCENVTIVKIGNDTVKVWSDGGGSLNQSIRIEVISNCASSFHHEAPERK